MHQSGRFAGAGAGDNQQRPVAVRGGLALPRVESSQQIINGREFSH